MKTTYTTSDGATFMNKAEAKMHEASFRTTQGLLNFLTARLPDLTPEEVDAIVAAVQEDPAAFREAVAPLLRKARKPRADAGIPRGRRPRAQVAAA